MAPASPSFFNIPADQQGTLGVRDEVRVLGPRQDHVLHTHWKTLEDRPLSNASLMDVFANGIPLVRQKAFLSVEECTSMLNILKTHQVVCHPISQ